MICAPFPPLYLLPHLTDFPVEDLLFRHNTIKPVSHTCSITPELTSACLCADGMLPHAFTARSHSEEKLGLFHTHTTDGAGTLGEIIVRLIKPKNCIDCITPWLGRLKYLNMCVYIVSLPMWKMALLQATFSPPFRAS